MRAQVDSEDAELRAGGVPEVQVAVLESAPAKGEGEARVKPVNDEFVEESESLAMESMKAMRAFLTYQGDNPSYYHKAKVAAVGLTNYVRLRATENNRMMVELTAQRQGPLPIAGSTQS